METGQIGVLHVDTELSWRGGQQQALQLHEGLAARGIRSCFVCRPGSSLEGVLKDRCLEYVSLPYRFEGDLLAGYKLAKLARDKGFTILILHSGHALSWGLMASFFFPSVKLVAVRRVAFATGKNIFSRWKYTNDRIAALVAVSDNARQVMLQDGISPAKVTVIRSGIDTTKINQSEPDPDFRQKWGISPESLLVGTTAAFTKEKNYPVFLQAAALASKQNPKLRFMAVGAGSLLDSMKHLAEDLGIGDKVIFAGQQSNIGKLLKAMDVFVLCSNREGLSNSVMEAMCAGLSVVATNVGGIPELVENGKTGLLVPPGEPQMLAETILKLAGDSELMNSLAQNAKAASREFDKETMVDSYLSLLRSL
jgi:glycosyltransferase involved in cell wall biosynthesis